MDKSIQSTEKETPLVVEQTELKNTSEVNGGNGENENKIEPTEDEVQAALKEVQDKAIGDWFYAILPNGKRVEKQCTRWTLKYVAGSLRMTPDGVEDWIVNRWSSNKGTAKLTYNEQKKLDYEAFLTDAYPLSDLPAEECKNGSLGTGEWSKRWPAPRKTRVTKKAKTKKVREDKVVRLPVGYPPPPDLDTATDEQLEEYMAALMDTPYGDKLLLGEITIQQAIQEIKALGEQKEELPKFVQETTVESPNNGDLTDESPNNGDLVEEVQIEGPVPVFEAAQMQEETTVEDSPVEEVIEQEEPEASAEFDQEKVVSVTEVPILEGDEALKALDKVVAELEEPVEDEVELSEDVQPSRVYRYKKLAIAAAKKAEVPVSSVVKNSEGKGWIIQQ